MILVAFQDESTECFAANNGSNKSSFVSWLFKNGVKTTLLKESAVCVDVDLAIVNRPHEDVGQRRQRR